MKQRHNSPSSLLTAPIELTGNWGHMIPDAALHVVERMRSACFDGWRLVSDDQPERLRVEERTSGGPAVWLHADGKTTTGWIIVAIGERDWSRLAYQFGHELGHVTANSWRPDAKPAAPSQWFEEAMVEAFSLRGLALLADSWSTDPPFKDDSGFGAAVAVYRQNIVERYGKLATEQDSANDLGLWFRQHRAAMEMQPGVNAFAQAASLQILAEAGVCRAAVSAAKPSGVKLSSDKTLIPPGRAEDKIVAPSPVTRQNSRSFRVPEVVLPRWQMRVISLENARRPAAGGASEVGL